MSGLECTEVNISSKDCSIRWNPEFFLNADMDKFKILSLFDCKALSEIAFVTDGEHGSPDWDNTSNIKYVTAEFIKPNEIMNAPMRTISLVQDMKNARCRLMEHDVLIYSVGVYAGYVCCAEPHLFPANIPRSVGLIRLNSQSEFTPGFLSVFLNCKYGRFQSVRLCAGNAQPVLAIENIESLIIPKLNNKLQTDVDFIYQAAYKKRLEAKESYSIAREILYCSLGLSDFNHSTQNTSVKNFSEVTESERLDAEYYHPKYDELMERIHANAEKIVLVKDIGIENHRGVQPDYIESGEIAVVNSKNILEDGLDYEGFSATSRASWELTPKAHIEKDDILIYTTGANIGRAAIYRGNKPALASNHVNILRVNYKRPQYVAFVIHSMIGRLQTERLSTGSAQQELYPSDIDEFVIPLVSEDLQAEIESLLDKSFALREQSKALLKAATRAVEIAIEQDEAAGMEFLHKFSS